VASGKMPMAGQTQPSDEEKAALSLWAQCGTPN
jgi:hypothetical protein